jgi:hypothetical protein
MEPTEMTVRSPKADPYCAFKDDSKRLQALVSRDVRIVLVTCGCVLLGGAKAAPLVIRWLGLG